MERTKKILKTVLLAAILSLRYVSQHGQTEVPAQFPEGIPHTLFSLTGEGTDCVIKFWSCRLSE